LKEGSRQPPEKGVPREKGSKRKSEKPGLQKRKIQLRRWTSWDQKEPKWEKKKNQSPRKGQKHWNESVNNAKKKGKHTTRREFLRKSSLGRMKEKRKEAGGTKGNKVLGPKEERTQKRPQGFGVQ